jgi:hypothetical protein
MPSIEALPGVNSLREAVLSALAKLGGDNYLVALGRENSSAFASLLNKVLPTQLSSASETERRWREAGVSQNRMLA